MRTDHVTLSSGNSPPRRHRPPLVWFARGIVLTLLLQSGDALAPRLAKADITYTWQEDDGQTVTGSLTVKSTAQANGLIIGSDVTAFTWSDPGESFSLTNLNTRVISIPISTADAAPTTVTSLFGITGSRAGNIQIAFDTNWNKTNGESWTDGSFGPPAISGTGEWIITESTTTAVPEPSTAVVAVIGAVTFITYGWSRHRRGQRRQAAA